MDVRSKAILCLALAMPCIAMAQSPFLSATDMRLREDLTLLADTGGVKLTVDEWPLPREDVAQALAGVRPGDLRTAAQRAALARVKAKLTDANQEQWKVREIRVSAGQPALLRDFATLGRENGEITTTGGASTSRYAISLSATAVANPGDGQHIRFDGSEISLRLGNWLLSLNQIDRWWGPGMTGSLILSTNARPMPALSLDRVRSTPSTCPYCAGSAHGDSAGSSGWARISEPMWTSRCSWECGFRSNRPPSSNSDCRARRSSAAKAAAAMPPYSAGY